MRTPLKRSGLSGILRALRVLGLCVLFVSMAFVSCVQTPAVYTRPLQEVESIRSDFGTIGVLVAPHPAELSFVRPARGPLGGAGRGFVVGGAAPVVGGAIAPIPGSMILGVLLAPVGAVVGTFYGAFSAPPAAEFDEAEAAIAKAIERLLARDSYAVLRDETVRLGLEHTQYQFVGLTDRGPESLGEIVRYDSKDLPGVDTVLELRAEKAGLTGLYTIDPDERAYVDLRIRVIRVSANEALYDDTISCSVESRTYREWAINEGEAFERAILRCVTPLAEKVVDDYFLLYPLPSQ